MKISEIEREAIENINGQIENGYIDISNSHPDEIEFDIVKRALKEYENRNKSIEISEEEENAIKCIKEGVEIWDKYSMPINYSDGWYNQLKIILKLIEKQQYMINGKDCVIETQAHNEEVLMDYFNRHTCLHCGKGKLGYCEECYQKLIAENAKLQEQSKELEKERDGIYDDYQDLGKEYYKLQTKNEEAAKKYSEMIKKLDQYNYKGNCDDGDFVRKTIKEVQEVK